MTNDKITAGKVTTWDAAAEDSSSADL